MTVKAVSLPQSVITSDVDPTIPAGSYKLVVAYVGLDPTNPVTPGAVTPVFAAATTQDAIKASIKTAVQDDLVTNHGYTFATGDEVKVIGW